MALQMTVTTAHGITLDAAYLRIDEQSGDKGNVNLRVHTYTTLENCQAGCPWIEEKIYNFVPSVADDAPNFIKQGYQYLKTLPEHSQAVDA
ncbi:hypothetical protein SAMN04487895_104215 [Paenibacillus sophorae]|uniref:Uncharacterized protein n=1 Tax=Paenibacillus sophorae TaxID=1333845 RepID=A0A1H8L7K7_9BACL|nr:hypothetical protein [Paenibacillus sophorae]QWU17399.1 hypothetical protein KP014_09725 [Paenibacillus sophorae]SEO01085.1 hypothetical protein SAMN04487895_104215 [Paenibacillus sophorae]